jgi:hypothetical protein
VSLSKTTAPGDPHDSNLPRRDWILLPAISLATVVLLALFTEAIARWIFPVSESGLDQCFVFNDLSGLEPARPNSVCRERAAESRAVAEYRFNSNSDRAGTELGPKPPETYRVVMIGSSFAFGLFVPREETFAALLPGEITRRTGRRTEVYNESTGGKFRGGPFPLVKSPEHFDHVLAPSPDLILWIITPNDIANAALDKPATELPPAEAVHAAQTREGAAAGTQHPSSRLANAWGVWMDAASHAEWRFRSRWEQARTSVLLKHFLIASQSQAQYVHSYLKNPENAEFLMTEPSAIWTRELENFESIAAEFARRAAAAHVPFAAAMIPNRAQAAMISKGDWPKGYDPYHLDREMCATITNHGGVYLKILSKFREIPEAERYYFPVDGHPDAEAHAIIAGLLAQELTGGAAPLMGVAPQTQTDLAKGR